MNNVVRPTLALIVVGLVGASGPPAAVTGRPVTCAAASTSLERAWGGTGEWRRLAPYPFPRDASPTDSIGVWLERWQLPDGSVELRRVSATETRVATLSKPACAAAVATHRRSFDSVAVANAFTDDRLRTLLRDTRDGMIYVWSPHMPLSIIGLDEANSAARTLGIAFTAVVAEARSADLRDVSVDTAYQRSFDALELVYRNATIHYPTAIFYRHGALLASAIPGYKSRETYVALGRAASPWEEPSRTGSVLPGPGPAPAFWVDHAARVTTVRSVETVRRVGFFFKPVAGTDLITYTSPGGGSYLFDLGTRREQRIPGNVDPVPSPDGRFVTRPGLIFYRATPLAAGDTTPMFVDRDLPDEYQTISILKQSRDALRYRVVTGWRTGLRFRDYDIALDRAGHPQRIQPLATPVVPCPERAFTLPISAKGSTEVGVFDLASRTNRVIRVEPDGNCADVLDLGFASGKLSFSYDGAAVAFATSRVNVDAEGSLLKPQEMFYKDALVLYRKTGRIVSLSSNRPLSGMTFPEFLPDGRSIILDQASRLRLVELIRVVEVK